ncbi:substrate-binding domain-containing protein, partial [bacterium]|nr:substrate-binding domain-containing protein [bacterium]
ISLYGRNSASGTYGYFKSKALFKGDYKDTVKEQPGSASVVQGVSEDHLGIGYSGIGYITSGVRAVPLSKKEGNFYTAEMKNVMAGNYPLARFLFIYVNKEPGKQLDPLVREFLKFVFSKEGQEIVVKDGYLPLPHKIAKEELAKLEEATF